MIDLYFKGTSASRIFCRYVAVADGFAHRVPVAGAGGGADHLTVADDGGAALHHHRTFRFQGKGAKPPFGPIFPDTSEGRFSDEIVFGQDHAKPQTGVVRRILRGEFRSPIGIPLFQMHGRDHPVAGVLDPEVASGLPEGFVHMAGKFGRNVQFISQFPHIGDPECGHRSVAHRQGLARPETELLIAHIFGDYFLQQVTAAGTGHVDDGIGGGNIGQRHRAVPRHMIFDPPPGAQTECGTHHHEKPILRQSRNGHVTLDGATLVAHLGVDHLAHRPVDPVGAQMVQKRHRARSRHLEFAKGGLVDERHVFTGIPMLRRHMFEPVGDIESVVVSRVDPFRGKPVHPLPTVLGAIYGAFLLEQVVKGTAPHAPGGIVLLMGPVDGVVLAVEFPGSLHIIGSALVVRTETADVQGPDVQARLSFDNPFRHHFPGTAAGGNPESIETGGHKAVVQLRRRPHDGVAVRGKAFRTVDQPGDPRLHETRRPSHGRFRQAFEMVEIGIQEL